MQRIECNVITGEIKIIDLTPEEIEQLLAQQTQTTEAPQE